MQVVKHDAFEVLKYYSEQKQGYKPPVQSVRSNDCIDSEGLRKMLHHKARQSSRKANKLLAKDTTLADIGKSYLAKTNVGLAPYNTKAGTRYMLPYNTECIAVERKGWTALYITNGLLYDSLQDVMDKCKHVRGRAGEFRKVDKPIVYRAANKVALKKMLPSDWIADKGTYEPIIAKVYGI